MRYKADLKIELDRLRKQVKMLKNANYQLLLALNNEREHFYQSEYWNEQLRKRLAQYQLYVGDIDAVDFQKEIEKLSPN